jgi:putative ABC transport system ATP-binding protein
MIDPPSIRLQGLCKSFRSGDQEVPVLKGIDLEIAGGETFFIVGPSGCGKTTLLSVLCGTLRADAGDLEVMGKDLRAARDKELARFRAKHIGFVFQQFNLIPALTALENVAVPLRIQRRPARESLSAAAALLDRMGLGAFASSRPSRLSGGQQQRVAIARALVHDPDLVVCDEPTSALDSETGREVMELIRPRGGETSRTVIVVTHDPRTYRFADRIAEMEDGRILRIGTPGNLPPSP